MIYQMKIDFLVGLTVVMILCGLNSAENKTVIENNTFVATHEWQEIAEGQAIPAGLHVRINLQSGKKEAKLLDDSEEPGRQALTSIAIDELAPERVKGEEESRLLLESKTEDEAGKVEITDWADKFKAFKDEMRKNFKTDAELIVQLFEEYRNVSKVWTSEAVGEQTATFVRILEDLSYLVHQLDNALLFIDKGGLDNVLLPIIINQTHVGLRSSAMRVLGALAQNNPKAQIKVFELNFGSYLSQILIKSTNGEELSTAMYAFGSLLRKFPLAQQQILSTHGMQAIVAVLSKECELKIKSRAAALISDMIEEQRLILEAPAGEQNEASVGQYKKLKFQVWLQANDYCETMDTLMSTKLYDFLEQPDIMEHFTRTLAVTRPYCMSLWSQSPQLRHTLLSLKNRYWQSKDEYRMEVSAQIDEMFNVLYPQTHMPHYEL